MSAISQAPCGGRAAGRGDERRGAGSEAVELRVRTFGGGARGRRRVWGVGCAHRGAAPPHRENPARRRGACCGAVGSPPGAVVCCGDPSGKRPRRRLEKGRRTRRALPTPRRGCNAACVDVSRFYPSQGRVGVRVRVRVRVFGCVWARACARTRAVQTL